MTATPSLGVPGFCACCENYAEHLVPSGERALCPNCASDYSTTPVAYTDHRSYRCGCRWYELDGAEFEEDEGFVCWYRYGENDLDPDTVEERSRSHRVDMVGDEETAMQKTAGSYLGKYLSMTFAALIDETDENIDDRESYSEKFASWKLAMYWATEKQFWSISRSIEREIDRDDQLDEDVARGVRWAAKQDVMLACESVGEDHFSVDALDDLEDVERNRSTVSQVVQFENTTLW